VLLYHIAGILLVQGLEAPFEEGVNLASLLLGPLVWGRVIRGGGFMMYCGVSGGGWVGLPC
jgi:hypothetical protein